MKVATFLTYTIAGTLAVLFGTLGVGQLAPVSPVPALLTGLGILLVLGALGWRGFRSVLSGPSPRRNDPSGPFWTPEARKMVGRKFFLVGAILSAGLAVGVVIFALTSATGPGVEAVESLSFHLQAMFLLATFTAIFATFPLSSALRDAAGVAPGLMKRINKVVLRGKDLPLTDENQHAAVRMAVVVPVILPLQNFGMAYLYGSLATQLIRALLMDAGDVFSAILLVLVVASVVFFVPFIAVQVRHASHYASKNAALLAD